LLAWVLDSDPYNPPRWDTEDRVLMVHILCMALAVALVSWAILSWNLSFIESHSTRKLIHFGLNASALCALIVGLAATIDWEGHSEYYTSTHFYSLHSWLGIIAIAFFVLQALGGISTFLLPFASADTRARALPGHKFFGAYTYAFLIFAGLTGIMNREAMLVYLGAVDSKGTFSYVANFLGLFVALMAGCVMYVLVTRNQIGTQQPAAVSVPQAETR
jgi:cytochrome b-561